MSASRPFWSVMIPTYHCAHFLTQTLQSVLSQDPGEQKMQIEVIDDGSFQDDPQTVVQSVGKGRVHFFRNVKNLGAIENFNQCIKRSRGYYVHILHGDDFVAPEFYKTMETLIGRAPQAALYACRSFIVDEQGELEGLSRRNPAFEIFSRAAEPLYYENVFFSPSVVIARCFYEAHGGFLPELIHTADWEMWARAISQGGGICLNQPLSYYRTHSKNDTCQLQAKGEHVRDAMRLGELFREKIDGFDFEFFRWNQAKEALRAFKKFIKEKNWEAARSNLDVCWQLFWFRTAWWLAVKKIPQTLKELMPKR